MKELTTTEYRLVDEALRYLKFPPREDCQIFWMDEDSPAKYWPLRDLVYLPDDRNCLKELIPTICHELCHREQRKKYGLLLYWVIGYFIWRRWTIEPAALKRFDEARKKMRLIG